MTMRPWFVALAMQVLSQQHTDRFEPTSYAAVRRYTGGLLGVMVIEDVANTGPITPDEYYRPETRRLELLANNVICWANDLLSVRVEVRQPSQARSLVTIIKDAEPRRSWREAVNLAAEQLGTEIAAFVDLAEKVRRTASPNLCGWIDGCQDVIVGNVDWSLHDTGRYSSSLAE